MAACDLDALLQAACASKFDCLDHKTKDALFLQLLCEIKTNGISGGSEPDLILDNLSLAGSLLVDQPHGLSQKPRRLVAVIKITSAVLGYSVGDEIELDSFKFDQIVAAKSFYTLGANATDIWWYILSPGWATWVAISAIRCPGRIGVAELSPTAAQAVGKLYVWK